jgi:hypothetical protein
MTRLFNACLGTETDSFSLILAGPAVFEEAMPVRGGRPGETPPPVRHDRRRRLP